MRGIRAVIFDFDGTLVLSPIDFGAMRRKVRELAADHRLKTPAADQPVLELLQDISAINDSDTAPFLAAAAGCIETIEVAAARKSRPVPGSVELVRRLKKRGLKIAIITRNSNRAVAPLIEKFGFPCDVLLTRNHVRKTKPHPAHIREALKRLRVRPGEALVVGDHPFEIRSANALRMCSAAVLTGGKNRESFLAEKPAFIFPDVTGLNRLFGLTPIEPGKLPNQLLSYLLGKYIRNDRSVLVGPAAGIDCAVVRSPRNVLMVKTDPITLVGEDIGYYLVNVNANDIAVMGGVPRWCAVTAVFPVGTTFPQVETLFHQLTEECGRHGINLVGGHCEISPAVNNTIAAGLMLGIPRRTRPDRAVRPRPGDKLMLVKEIGIEAASIMAREKTAGAAGSLPASLVRRARLALRRPGISVRHEAALLWENTPVRAMHDPTEGGIAAGIAELAQAHGVGLRVDATKLRFFPPAAGLCRRYGLDPLGVISSGCLLALMPAAATDRALALLKRRRIPASVIGEVRPAKEGVRLVRGQTAAPMPEFAADEITRLHLRGQSRVL